MNKPTTAGIRAHSWSLCVIIVGVILCATRFLTECHAQSSKAQLLKNDQQDGELEQEYQQAVKTMQKDAGINDQGSNSVPQQHNPPPTDQEKYPRLKIVRGNEGLPFPEPSEVVLQPTSTRVPFILDTPKPVPTPTPWKNPGRCQNNQTVRVEHSAEESDNAVVYDKLFIDQDLIPSDEQEAFGAYINLYPYGGEDEGGTLVRMELYEVPCVPYRIRMTRRSYFYDSGLNALKNYDKDYAGKGVFHTFIAQKLFGKPRSR